MPSSNFTTFINICSKYTPSKVYYSDKSFEVSRTYRGIRRYLQIKTTTTWTSMYDYDFWFYISLVISLKLFKRFLDFKKLQNYLIFVSGILSVRVVHRIVYGILSPRLKPRAFEGFRYWFVGLDGRASSHFSPVRLEAFFRGGTVRVNPMTTAVHATFLNQLCLTTSETATSLEIAPRPSAYFL